MILRLYRAHYLSLNTRVLHEIAEVKKEHGFQIGEGTE